MAPAPSPGHQTIIGELYLQLANFLKNKPCKVYLSPFDVRLNPETSDDTVVQADLLIVCDPTKIDNRGCNGPPNMVIEILSPSSSRHDRFIKLKLYQRYGVKEYWIVDPETKTLQTFILDEGCYYTNIYYDTNDAPVQVLENCIIHLPEVF